MKHLRLVHSVNKPEVETAESSAPGLDEFQNGLAGLDRVRQWLHQRIDALDSSSHRWEGQILTIMGLALEQFEMSQRQVQQERIDRIRNRHSGGES